MSFFVLTSSIYPQPAIFNTGVGATVPINTDILDSDIPISRELVRPGGGGILRLYFAFVLAGDSIITVTNNGTNKGTLNADNASTVVSGGYYRFDIDVEEGDNINLQSNTALTIAGSFFRAHFVRFGA